MTDHRELAARLLRVCCHVGNRVVNGVMQEAAAALSDLGDRLQDAQRELADREIESKNFAANQTARLLKEIVDTGEHRGVFGGEDVEAAAQAILKLRAIIEAWRPILQEATMMGCYGTTSYVVRDAAKAALALEKGA